MKRKQRFRLAVQIVFVLIVSFIAFNHFLAESGKELPFIGSYSLHAICPFGGVEAITSLLQYGVWIKKIHPSSMSLLVIIIILSIAMGPVVCSYMCPLGSIQEWFSKLGRKIFKKRFNHFVPEKVHNILKYFRYVVLVLVIYATAKSISLVFMEVDPYFALFNFWSHEVTIGGLIVLGLTLVLSLVIERPWCKYACPFGALVGLTNFFSISKVRVNKESCISCSMCSKGCPMNIDVKQFEIVKDPQCIRCGICTSESDCPVNETVSISTKKIKNKKLNFSTKSTALIVLVSVFLGVFILNSLGLWETDNSKVKVENINDSSIELIKGSYTFATIEENYDVDVETLARAFNLTGDNLEGMKINVLESAYGGLEVEIGTESIKYFIALYNGVDFYPNYLPSTAVDVLLELGKIDQAFIEESSLYIVEVDSSNKIEVVVEESEEGEGVNGNTTVQDVINQGLTIEQVETILTVEVPNPNLSIKFICDENNLSFGKIKTAISDAIHALD